MSIYQKLKINKFHVMNTKTIQMLVSFCWTIYEANFPLKSIQVL
jgi:hypothetical protein